MPYYMSFRDGHGMGTGSVNANAMQHHIDSNDNVAYLFFENRALIADYEGQAHKYSFDLNEGIKPKQIVEIAVDKDTIVNDDSDAATLTWNIPKEVDVMINGTLLSNNPHEDGLIIKHDQIGTLHVRIWDHEYYGETTIHVVEA